MPALTPEQALPGSHRVARAFRAMQVSDPGYDRLRNAFKGKLTETFDYIGPDGRKHKGKTSPFGANYLQLIPADMTAALEISNWVIDPEEQAVEEQDSDSAFGSEVDRQRAGETADQDDTDAQIEKLAAKKADPREAEFRRLIESARLPTKVPKVHRGQSAEGDAYVLVWEGPIVEGKRTVTVDYNDAKNMRTFFVDGTDDEVDFDFKRVYTDGTCHSNVYLDLDDGTRVIEKWQIDPELIKAQDSATLSPSLGTKAEHWVHRLEDGKKRVARRNDLDQIVRDDRGNVVYDSVLDADGNEVDLWPLPNPYSRSPVFGFHNEGDPWSPYGLSDIEAAIKPQHGIDKLKQSKHEAHDFARKGARIVLHDDPTATEGDEDDEDEDFDEDDPHGETAESALRKRERKAERISEVNPGDWIDAYGKTLHELQTDKPEGYIASKEDEIVDLAITGMLPLIHVLPKTAGAISGEAYRRAAYLNTIKKNGRKRDNGTIWAQVGAFIAEVGQMGKIKVHVEWASDGLTDIDEAYDQVDPKLKLGIPAEQIMLELGYPAAKVELWAKIRELKAQQVAEQVAQGAQVDEDGKPVQNTPAGTPATGTAPKRLTVAK